MKSNKFYWLLLIAVIILSIYIKYFVIAFFHVALIDHSSKTIHRSGDVIVVIPKVIYREEIIDVEVIYLPNLYNAIYESINLKQISFRDERGYYDYTNQIILNDTHSEKTEKLYSLRFIPRYFIFKYKVPTKLCSQSIVYTTCKLKPTQKGKGMIDVQFDPEYHFHLSEGYQGDGEHLYTDVEVK